jgi:rhomboid protease GluP
MGLFGNGEGLEGMTVENLQNVEKHRVLFLSGRRRVKNPNDEHYGDMLMDMCCPVFSCLSMTTAMLIIYLAIFIAEAAIGLQRSGDLLQIKIETLIEMGANWPILIRHGEVWRLITAAVLHVNFMHFFGNFTSTIILLSRFEYSFGTVRCIIFYIAAAISGNIFSALCVSNEVKAGASTSLYGLLGVMLGYLIINWSGLNCIGPILKCQLICVCFMLILFTILFTSVSGPTNIDYYGHLGGFLAGLWLSAINPTIDNESCEKYLRIGAIVILVVQFIIFFVLFYTLNLNFAP